MSNEMTRWDDQQGFSLMEVLISLSVFTIVLFAVYTTFTASHRTFARGEDKIELQQTIRVAMGMAASEIRTAGYDPSNPAVIPVLPSPTAIQAANANSLTFVADVDGNNVTDQVTYRLQGTQLIRDFGGAPPFPALVSEQLADGVTALSFAYFDSSDNPTATLANIRRITIGLTVQETGVGGQQSLPLTMDVRLRNVQ